MVEKNYNDCDRGQWLMPSIYTRTSESANGSKHILVVDGSIVLRGILRTALQSEGFDVVSVRDAAEAITTMRMDDRIDLIITDFHMPGLDGAELTRAVRANARYHKTPVLVLTAGADETDKQRSRDAGASGWIVKPFDTTKLIAAIHKLAA